MSGETRTARKETTRSKSYNTQLMDYINFLPHHTIIEPLCAAYSDSGRLPDTKTNLAINSMSKQKVWKRWTIQIAQAMVA